MKILVAAVLAFLMVAGVAWACASIVTCPYDGANAYSAGYVYCQNGRLACKYAHGYGANRHVIQESCE